MWVPTTETRKSSEDVGVRLRRAAGQLAGVHRMHAAGRPCVELVDQLHAVAAALDAVALQLAEQHLRDSLRGDGSEAAVTSAVTVLRHVARRPSTARRQEETR